MPFDAMMFDTDALACLNIVPVSPTMVASYRTAVIDRYVGRSSYYRDLVQKGYAQWRTVPLPRHGLGAALANPPTRRGFYTNDTSGAPHPLIALAVHVRDNVESAEFSLDFFDTDPVLNVFYDGKNACLGIWDQGRLVHIADWQRPTLFDNLKRRFPRLAAMF